MNNLSKIFFNSVEEMNECYGVDAEMPSKLYSNADLVCYDNCEYSDYSFSSQSLVECCEWLGLNYYNWK